MIISVIQPDTLWEDKKGNLLIIERLISGLDKTDLVVLPEMFTTGFSMSPRKLCEEPGNATCKWMSEISAKGNFAICGSYIVRENDRYLNRWVFVTPEGASYKYDKRHLFRMDGEEEAYSPGNQRVIFKFRDFRIMPNICYDLRFPVWSRNQNDYDLLINSANWPESRSDVWITLLRARAMENLCYVAGSNRVGTDGNGIKYRGDSMIIGPKGDVLVDARGKVSAISADLSIVKLREFRKKFPAHLDADKFTID